MMSARVRPVEEAGMTNDPSEVDFLAEISKPA